MADLIDEVREELKAERYAALWHKYGRYLIGFAVAIVFSTGVGVWYKGYSHSSAAAQGDRFYEIAQEAGTLAGEETLTALESIYNDGDNNFAALAGMKRASILLRNGKKDDALYQYKSITDNSDIAGELRDLSALMSAAIQINGDISALDEKEVSALLSRLSDKSAWKYSARELQALMTLRLGDVDKALEYYSALASDLEAPVTLRNRTREFADMIQGQEG